MFVLSAAAISACLPDEAALRSLAAAGQVQAGAPLHARHAAVVRAPAATVWALLVEAERWPRWHPAILSVRADGPLETGVVFEWEQAGAAIRSTVALADRERVLAWTGTASVARAIHVWRLRRGPDGGTLVEVEETMDGPILEWLYPQERLDESLRSWLEALRAAAERTERR